MKNSLFLLTLVSFFSYAQISTIPTSHAYKMESGGFSVLPIYTKEGFISKDGVYRYNTNDNTTEGSKLLFENFNNEGILSNTNNKKYSIKNINIDLESKDFVSRVSKDTLFYFNNVKYALINDVLFEKVNGAIYEKIFDGEKITLYVSHSAILRDEVIDKLSYKVVKPKHWLKRETIFFNTANNDNLQELKLNKKRVLSIFDANETKQAKAYVKEQGLSYRNKKDVVKLLQYYDAK